MAEEISVYRDANIHVTNLRAMLQGKTYAMANVTSVSTYTQEANTAVGVLIAICGAIVLLMGVGIDALRGCGIIFGISILAVGIGAAVMAKNVYWVRIGSASGETNALSSRDRDYIERVVSAMNEAIVRRG